LKKTGRKSVRRKGLAVTIDEVAALAKVSSMTVSRVVNGHGKVRESTRERVLEAVQKLGYVPNAAASSLAAAQDARIAFIYTNPSAGYLRELLLGAMHGAARAAAQLVLADWDELDAGAERKAARALAKGVAGVILPPPLCESKVVIEELVGAGVPVVAIASGRFNHDISSVRIDDFLASKEITEYLIKMGHARIGFIKGHPNQTASTRRFEGYQAALKDAGIALDPALVQQGYFTYRSALPVVETLLTARKQPTAIFASNDDMAAAAACVARQMGLELPAQLSIAGFDDAPVATMTWPQLATVRQPVRQMGRGSADLIIQHRPHRQGWPHPKPRPRLDLELVMRGSVAPARA
jgi:LacI family transcriptional regulator